MPPRYRHTFLSRLCGGERELETADVWLSFLSRLCGGELKYKAKKDSRIKLLAYVWLFDQCFLPET